MSLLLNLTHATGEGQALAYFVSYLKRMLPNFPQISVSLEFVRNYHSAIWCLHFEVDRSGIGKAGGFLRVIDNTGLAEDLHRWATDYELSTEGVSTKFYIIVPKSGICAKKFSDCDSEIESCENTLPDIQSPRAGDQSRKLTRSMHQIKDPADDKIYYFCGEFAGPVKTLQGIFSLVDQTPEVTQQFQEQVSRFAALLEQLSAFEQTKAYAQKYVVFHFDDEDANQRPLSEMLLVKIKSDIAET